MSGPQRIYETRLMQQVVRNAIGKENDDQLVKWGVQEHPLWRWFLILAEEVGEAADAYLEMEIERDEPEMMAFIAILGGVGERAKQILEGDLADRVNARQEPHRLGHELVQVAAVAVAMEESRRRLASGVAERMAA